MDSRLIRRTRAALAEECAVLHGVPPPITEAGFEAAALAHDQSALCLSGGGIRSAAYCLGVVQALARAGLLAQFHYLSTVSGGGFIGGWLMVLARRLGGAAALQRLLAQVRAAPELSVLRGFTNYLTPRGGPFSADTWTGLVLLVRNLVLNWLVILPWFLAAIGLSLLYEYAAWHAGQSPFWSHLLAAASALALLVGTVRICLALPSHRATLGPDPNHRAYLPPRQVVAWVVVPTLLWTALLPMTFSREWAAGGPTGPEWALPLAYIVVTALGYAAATAWDAARGPAPAWARLRHSAYLANAPAWLVASACAAAALWLGLSLGRHATLGEQPELLAVLGPPWFILVNAVHSAVHVGLRPEAALADLDREWLARVSALKVRSVLLWAVFAACCLVLSHVLLDATAPSWRALCALLTTGPVAAWLGKQAVARVEGADAPRLIDRVFGLALPLLCLVFAAVLFALLGASMISLVDAVSTERPALALTGMIAALALAGWGFGHRINVNRFSLHGVYRNRLTRAFLGSARDPAERDADPLTGFDESDNLPLTWVLPTITDRHLFPVINTTLNLTLSERLAWSERKAAPFTFTPLRAGAAALDAYVLAGRYGGLDHRVDAPAAMGPVAPSYGVRLSGALTISGAAISPNWGYHSSPLTAFVMTLFNVRLGAWLPNPGNPQVAADPAELAAAMPRSSAFALFNELIGRTDARSRAIYLSDGGHFDNLGLYEMLRRRCRFILVVDAGQDEAASLRDLGEALRRADVDLSVRVAMDVAGVRSRANAGHGPPPTTGFGVGQISYPGGGAGVLIYLKASWLEGMPVEVASYAERSPSFPHETTLDQMFTESQFESYRRLGEWQAERLVRGNATLGELFFAPSHRPNSDRPQVRPGMSAVS